MLRVLKALLESPDRVAAASIDWRNIGTHPFFIYKNKVYVGGDNKTHYELAIRMREEGIFPSRFSDDDVADLARDGKCSGRVWAVDRIISFWNYPKNQAEMEKVIKGLQRYAKMDSDLGLVSGNWQVELSDGELVRAADYVSKNKAIGYNVDKPVDKDDAWLRDRMEQHKDSPLGKKPGANVQPKKDIPKGWTYAQYHGTVYQENQK